MTDYISEAELASIERTESASPAQVIALVMEVRRLQEAVAPGTREWVLVAAIEAAARRGLLCPLCRSHTIDCDKTACEGADLRRALAAYRAAPPDVVPGLEVAEKLARERVRLWTVNYIAVNPAREDWRSQREEAGIIADALAAQIKEAGKL